VSGRHRDDRGVDRAARTAQRATRRRRRAALALLAPLVLLLGGCAADAPQDTLQPAGPVAREIQNLVSPVFIIAGVVFVLVEFGVLFLLFKFRQRRGDDPDELPGQTHGNTKLEIGWTILPAVLLAGVGLLTLRTLFNITDIDDDLTVQVTGQQWWWEYTYDTNGDGRFDDEDLSTANDLVIPAGQNVGLEVTARDVVHSFWVPRLNGKKDAVPGRVHPLTINADQPGTYVGQCTEYCGLSHGYMRQRVVALPPDEFEAWLEAQQDDARRPAEAQAAAGADLFSSQCSVCHLARGVNDDEFEAQGAGTSQLVAGRAPELTHFATRGAFAGATFDLWVDLDGDGIVEADEIGADNGGQLNRAALEAWLRNPPAEKPMDPATPEELDAGELGRGMPNLNLSEDQIDQLVAFLETLT
jgi:cytochrome c oxidase subunit 2